MHRHNPAVGKSVLATAKAYLCWEVFGRLTIQLVPIQDAVAYYYPPNKESHSIVLYYHASLDDFSEPLFLLFHEAGHARQWSGIPEQQRESHFRSMLNLDTGKEKTAFEEKAWEAGRELFTRFIEKEHLSKKLLHRFDDYKRICLTSYRDE